MDALATYALRLGDDSLILGQRLGEWCGHAPALEVDLSLANVALDQIGQATHFLGLAGAIEGAALESSTVDIGSEFSTLIETQRAYATNARVITVADEFWRTAAAAGAS